MCCVLFFPPCPGVKGLAGMVWGTFFHVWLFHRGGEGGLKLFGQCPYWTNTFQKGASLTKTSSTDTVCLRVLGLPWPISRSISKLHLWYIGYECIKALLTLWIPNDIKESLIPQPLIMLIRRPTCQPHQRSCCRWWEGTRARLGSHWHMPWAVDA